MVSSYYRESQNTVQTGSSAMPSVCASDCPQLGESHHLLSLDISLPMAPCKYRHLHALVLLERTALLTA